MVQLPAKAEANPTKAFFVRMITRDISLIDCILDLIDNSVDAAWQLKGGRPNSYANKTNLTEFRIEIVATALKFTIRDNCGGITLDNAAKYAFTFGRSDKVEHDPYSIGVYGIGMKRAVFKLGTKITIRSTYEVTKARTKMESFHVPIDVSKWLGSKPWDFDLEADPGLEEPGIEISVGKLNDSTSRSFGNPEFLRDLRRTVARDYALHLHRGLSIKINGEEVKGWDIELRESKNFQPLRHSFKDRDSGVDVEIVAGMAAPPPESSEPDDVKDRDTRSGWYVVCNGRIVVAGDKTAVTGWGSSGWPKWHPQYEGFIGLIFFTSKDAQALPLTTTKRSVDSSSAIYQSVMPTMRDVSKDWIAYTNARKQMTDQAKQMEDAAEPIPIYEISRNAAIKFPTLVGKTKLKPANISYPVEKRRAEKLADAFGDINMTYRDIGLRSFEYAYSEFVGKE
jgi:hypothetical protein